ncbi:MAG: hypothetical protein QNJ41_27685, partial [Xenococcaceae cyanobacterium MO_188.B32]|nr:hypothetical protein [Xenococcaceae cyanobacterium MO_188.B32]
MESSKFNLNKIILSAVTFGAASFGIGMLISNNNVGKALATGAIGGTASATGALITGVRKKEDNNLPESSLNKIQELQDREKQLQDSIAEKTTKRDEVEVGINSLQTEHQQLVEEISNLNNQKQKLETEYNTWHTKVQESEQTQQALNQDLLSLETRKQKLDREQEDLSQSLTSLQEQKQELEATLTTKQIELEQTIGQVSQAQQQQEEIEKEHHNLQSQLEELEKQRQQLDRSLATDNVHIESINQQSDRELEGLVDRLSEEQIEQFSEETPVDLDLEQPLAESEQFTVENELEGLM